MPTGPNVILVVTDDQGYGDVAYNGNPVLDTPHTDRLHADGVNLTDFHVSPTCSPTRAALMTGRYDDRVGVWHTINGRSILPDDEVTMADAFADAGYRTGMFGKWHLGDNHPFRPTDRGFDEALIHGGGGVAQTPDYWGNDYFDDTYRRNGTPETVDGYCTDVWFEAAIDFIDRHREEPFFCYVATNAPHTPLQVPREFWEPYADAVPEDVARFYGMIANIDENLGRLRDHLADWDLAEDTIIVFLGDNGSAQAHYNAGMRGAKGSPYDGGHRVPCVFHWPGRYEGRTLDRLSAGYDLLPTLIEACELPDPGVEFDGSSLHGVLSDESPDAQDRTIFVDSQRVETPRKWKDSAVCTPRWRLVRGEELYDIDADPGQTEDVAAEHPDVVAELRAAYEAWWEDIRPFPPLPAPTVASDVCPVVLTAHDWHDADGVPWNQGHVLAGMDANGSWVVDVTEPGSYRFELRRWPPESDAPVTGLPTDFTEMDYGSPGGGWTASAAALPACTARLRVGETEESSTVSADATAVTFERKLDVGRRRVWTAFETDDVTRGAYYVRITPA